MKNLNRGPEQDSNTQFFKIGRRLFLCSVIALSAGCQNIIKRGQSPDDAVLQFTESSDANTKYVADDCRIWGIDFAKVEGIGLVYALDGTGSSPGPSGQRDYLTKELISQGNKKPKAMLDSPNTSIVAIQGLLPPGIRKGDRFDIQVTPIHASETTSLKNGMLINTRLRPMKLLGRNVKKGSVTGVAKGRVLVDSLFETRQDEANELRGWILGGGVATEDRPIGLSIRTEANSPMTSTKISRAINSRFTYMSRSGKKGVATPKTDRQIDLVVPDNYRDSVGHFLQVVLNIAYDESSSKMVNRLDELDLLLSDPARTKITALRMEAIGKTAVPSLKRALRHHDMEVQFNAARALAYMGEADAIKHLKEIAEAEPAFRWHALTALSSMQDIDAGIAITDLMHSESSETRYGAYRALKARSPHDPLVEGEWLADDFYFSFVPSTASPMLHFSRSSRPEIVVFGEDQHVSNDFLHVESGLTVKAIGNQKMRITSYSVRDGEVRKTCSTQVSDLIRTLAELDVDYGQMLALFRAAKSSGMLDSRLVINAMPSSNRSRDDAAESGNERSSQYISEQLPELFRQGNLTDQKVRRSDIPVAASTNKDKNEATSGTGLSKMKDWFTPRGSK